MPHSISSKTKHLKFWLITKDVTWFGISEFLKYHNLIGSIHIPSSSSRRALNLKCRPSSNSLSAISQWHIPTLLHTTYAISSMKHPHPDSLVRSCLTHWWGPVLHHGDGLSCSHHVAWMSKLLMNWSLMVLNPLFSESILSSQWRTFKVVSSISCLSGLASIIPHDIGWMPGRCGAGISLHASYLSVCTIVSYPLWSTFIFRLCFLYARIQQNESHF